MTPSILFEFHLIHLKISYKCLVKIIRFLFLILKVILRYCLFNELCFITKSDSTIVNVGPLFTSGILLPEKYLLLVASYFNYKVIVYVF
jgi:hypothetical protein